MADAAGHVPGKASPWPLLVALGIAASEVGVLFGLVPVAVGGVLLFGGSCAGMAVEAGYAGRAWAPLRFVGVAVGGGGALVWLLRAPAATPEALGVAAATDGIAARAAIVLAAGALLVLAGLVGPAIESLR